MRRIWAALVITLLLGGCNKEEPVRILKGTSMGTTYMVRYYGDKGPLFVQVKTEQLLSAFEREFSNWRDDSWISQFNESDSTEWVEFPAHVGELLKISQELYKITDGRLDPTVSPLIELWGFGVEKRRSEPPTDSEIATIMKRCGFGKLLIDFEQRKVRKEHSDLQLNFSAIAKGYAVDQIAMMMKGEGIASYLIEFGGEIRAGAEKPSGDSWAVAINEAQLGSSQLSEERLIEMIDSALATSGHYRKNFTNGGTVYAHLLNPQTGRPALAKFSAVTVQAESCAWADGLATAFLVMEEAEAKAMLTERSSVLDFFFTENDSPPSMPQDR